MKKGLLSSGLVFLLLTIPLTLFLHLVISLRYFSFSLPLWDINLLFCFESAIVLLGLVWVVYSMIISKFFNLDFKEALKKDLYTYSPLFLLLFSSLNLSFYTNNRISTPVILAVILFLIVILKVAVILHLKDKAHKNYVCLLSSFAIILPLVVINCFSFSYLSQPTTKPEPKLKPEPSQFKNLYNADPLSLFSNNMAGVYKKKIKIASEIRNTLVLLPPMRIEAMLDVPAESYLQFGFGAWDKSYTGEGDGIQLNLFLKNKDELKKVYTKYIDPKHYQKDRRWFDIDIDLRDYVNQEVSIIFEVLGSREIQSPFEREVDNRDDYLAISDPKIVPYNPKVDPQAKNIIFISIDTLRADHLGCYGYKRKNISPNIDKLAKAGILFENAISHSPWTLPSHMSMFTSLLPSYHRMVKGFNDNYTRLSGDIVTLAEILKSNGYTTTAFSSGGYVAGELGFCKGFDIYKGGSFTSNSSFHKLTKWLEAGKNRPFFLFLHTYRVHAPYADITYVPEVMTESEIDELNELIEYPPNGVFLQSSEEEDKLKEMGLFKKEVTETLYDGGINDTDKYIGRLIETLKKLGILNHTIIVLTSDHGDEFGDHNPNKFYDSHNHSLYDELIRVPLIFVIPGFSKEKRIDYQVRLIDIMPTLLSLTNIRHDATKMQGTSLLPILRGGRAKDELIAISEALGGNMESKSIRTNRLKYIYTVNLDKVNEERILISDDPDKEELYDLEYDSGEKYNLQTEELSLSNNLKNEINNILEEAVKTLSVEGQKRIEIDEETKNRLKDLGYIQ